MTDKMIEVMIVMTILIVVLHHLHQDQHQIEREDLVRNLIPLKEKRKEVVQENTQAKSIVIVDLVAKIVKEQENTADHRRLLRLVIIQTTKVKLNPSKNGSSD